MMDLDLLGSPSKHSDDNPASDRPSTNLPEHIFSAVTGLLADVSHVRCKISSDIVLGFLMHGRLSCVQCKLLARDLLKSKSKASHACARVASFQAKG